MAARAAVLSCIPQLHKALSAEAINSPEYKAIDKALAALTPVFGQQDAKNLVPAAIAAQANAVKTGASPMGNVAPPLVPSPPPGAEEKPPMAA